MCECEEYSEMTKMHLTYIPKILKKIISQVTLGTCSFYTASNTFCLLSLECS